MKIAFIMYQGNMFSGGQGIYTYYLTRELARLGHEVHVIAGLILSGDPDLAERAYREMQYVRALAGLPTLATDQPNDTRPTVLANL